MTFEQALFITAVSFFALSMLGVIVTSFIDVFKNKHYSEGSAVIVSFSILTVVGFLIVKLVQIVGTYFFY